MISSGDKFVNLLQPEFFWIVLNTNEAGQWVCELSTDGRQEVFDNDFLEGVVSDDLDFEYIPVPKSKTFRSLYNKLND